MRIKRSAIVLFCLFAMAGPVFADSQCKIDSDPLGNPYYFWLETGSAESTLKFLSSSLSQPQTLHAFSREVSAYDIDTDNSKFDVVYSLENKVYMTSSRDNGNTFSDPLLLTDQGSNPSVAIQGDLLLAAWEENTGIHYRKWEDGFINQEMTETLLITGETLSSPSLAMDDQEKGHLVFSSKDINTQINRIIYASLASPEPKVLFESHDELVSIGINAYGQHLFVFWQENYLQRKGSYFSVSLDGGRTFCRPKSFELSSNLVFLILRESKLLALFQEDPLVLESGMVSNIPGTELKSKEIELPALAVPEMVFPASGAVLKPSDLKLSYALPGGDPLICRIELSQENDLNSWGFEQLATSESPVVAEYSLPVELSDGNYLLRIHFSDGISQGPDSSAVQFKVDSQPPQLQTCEAERVDDNLILRGKINEYPAWLTINGQPASLESTCEAFESSFALAPGKNLFTFELTDEAGNLAITTQEVFYDPAVPEIAVTSPKATDWFKPDSVIVIEAGVSDLQGDIQDGAEARITIDDRELNETLLYDAEEISLFGFVSLPENLTDGTHRGTIALPDNSGNQGVAEFTINIDGTPPLAEITAGSQFFTNSQTSIALPVKDPGAGLDPAGTLLFIGGISLEGKTSTEAQEMFWLPVLPLSEGTYEVQITARDKVGNVAETLAFCLVVDLTCPELTLLGSYEPTTSSNRITIQGKVSEEHPQTVNVYNGQQKVNSLDLSSDHFSCDINLIPGNNDIRVEVMDCSGNRTEALVSTVATFAPAAAGLIQSCAHGPNPFSPGQNLAGAFSTNEKGMVFTYSLAQPANLRILIFDLTGTLVWTREIKNTTSGATAWSGVDVFGQVAKNGIYPYVFSATSNGRTEIRRGKIIVYQ